MASFFRFLQDVRCGLRAHDPGFAAVAVLSLLLGIGATTAMFSRIYAVLLHPFPDASADRIVNPVAVDKQHPDEPLCFRLSKAQFDDLRLAAPVDSPLGFNNSHLEITGGALPQDIWGIHLTENAETSFGRTRLLGRNVEPSDVENGGHSVVVLNYRLHFGGLYGVIRHIVRLRTRELGVRVGATRQDVLRLVFRQGFKFACIAFRLDLLATLLLGRLIASLLYEVSLFNPAALFAASAVLILTILAVATSQPGGRRRSVPGWR